jgi:hypothetical protein
LKQALRKVGERAAAFTAGIRQGMFPPRPALSTLRQRAIRHLQSAIQLYSLILQSLKSKP